MYLNIYIYILLYKYHATGNPTSDLIIVVHEVTDPQNNTPTTKYTQTLSTKPGASNRPHLIDTGGVGRWRRNIFARQNMSLAKVRPNP